MRPNPSLEPTRYGRRLSSNVRTQKKKNEVGFVPGSETRR
jgi:hypothetical protein